MERLENGIFVEVSEEDLLVGDTVRYIDQGEGVITTVHAPLSEEYLARQWRDSELKATDSKLQSDRPDLEKILAYRQALRDWPSTEDFPNIKPVE